MAQIPSILNLSWFLPVRSMCVAKARHLTTSARRLEARRDHQPLELETPRTTSNEAAQNLLRASADRQEENEAKVEAEAHRRDMETLLPRRWSAGDVYAPHDLSSTEMVKWARKQDRGRAKRDIFDVLRINPIDHYKNFTIMSEFVTDMGRIQSSKQTGLRAINQRRIAKAVKRAQGVGLMPRTYKHPELLRIRLDRRR